MTRFTGQRFAGAQAGIGGATPKRRQHWRTVDCPVETCQARPQEKCRRRISEVFNSSAGGFTGEGRWTYLKHPHLERVKVAGGRVQ